MDSFELIGQTLLRKYRVDACVGEGGFAIVYKGEHTAMRRPVAIKCLKVPAHFSQGARQLFLAKFQEEGAHLSQLSDHPAIVKVFDLDTTDAGVPFLVLEWLDGCDLATLLGRERAQALAPRTDVDAIRLLRPALEGLAFAHSLGITHRDVKPHNLFLAHTRLGQSLKILDFGVAKAMAEGEAHSLRETGTAGGFHAFSPGYGAPEQFSARRYGATGPWTDVHALGLVLSELSTGTAPYAGEELVDWAECALSDKRPTPRTLGGSVSDDFEQIIAKCLHRMPRERFASAGDLCKALQAAFPGAFSDSATSPARSQRPPERVRGASADAGPMSLGEADTVVFGEPVPPTPAGPELVVEASVEGPTGATAMQSIELSAEAKRAVQKALEAHLPKGPAGSHRAKLMMLVVVLASFGGIVLLSKGPAEQARSETARVDAPAASTTAAIGRQVEREHLSEGDAGGTLAAAPSAMSIALGGAGGGPRGGLDSRIAIRENAPPERADGPGAPPQDKPPSPRRAVPGEPAVAKPVAVSAPDAGTSDGGAVVAPAAPPVLGSATTPR